MSTKDRLKLAAADVLARVVIYGPLAAAAIMWSPVSLVVIALAAGQPWVGMGLTRAGEWLTAKYPNQMTPINNVLSKWGGMPWWKHATFFITALAVAIVPAPAIAAHLPGFLKAGLGLLGGANSVWTQAVLPFALATGLPFATKMATDGFEWVFQQIPFLRDASIQRQQQRADRAAARKAAFEQRTHQIDETSPFAGAPEAPGHVAPDQSTPPAPQAAEVPAAEVPVMPSSETPDPTPLARIGRVSTPSRIRVITATPRVLPPVVQLTTPPRIRVPGAPSVPIHEGLGG